MAVNFCLHATFDLLQIDMFIFKVRPGNFSKNKEHILPLTNETLKPRTHH